MAAMNSATMIEQILDFNKRAFDDSFNAMIAVQEHTEKIVFDFWRRSEYFPEEGKKVVGDCLQTYKNGLDEFKVSVDSRFKLVEDYLQNATIRWNRRSILWSSKHSQLALQLIGQRKSLPLMKKK
jgi:polyhydroxyalkanoate synthesis regulator phasin